MDSRRITIDLDYYELDRPLGGLRIKEYKSPDHEEVIRGATRLEDALEALLASQERALGVAKEALEDAERVCEWGEPQPKPVLARVREALTQIEGEGEK